MVSLTVNVFNVWLVNCKWVNIWCSYECMEPKALLFMDHPIGICELLLQHCLFILLNGSPWHCWCVWCVTSYFLHCAGAVDPVSGCNRNDVWPVKGCGRNIQRFTVSLGWSISGRKVQSVPVKSSKPINVLAQVLIAAWNTNTRVFWKFLHHCTLWSICSWVVTGH